MNALSSGAEAIIYEHEGNILKDRIEKSYRLKEIDSQLRKSRTNREAKVLERLKGLIPCPKILRKEETKIIMEKIPGKQLKTVLDKNPKLAESVGKNLAVMHDNNIIHGDLTTSNMIITTDENKKVKKDNNNNKLYFIDFGLSFFSAKIEDKAVDIHLFKQALKSRHYKIFDKAYEHFLKFYNPKDKKEILKRLEQVEMRGRYKEKT